MPPCRCTHSERWASRERDVNLQPARRIIDLYVLNAKDKTVAVSVLLEKTAEFDGKATYDIRASSLLVVTGNNFECVSDPVQNSNKKGFIKHLYFPCAHPLPVSPSMASESHFAHVCPMHRKDFDIRQAYVPFNPQIATLTVSRGLRCDVLGVQDEYQAIYKHLQEVSSSNPTIPSYPIWLDALLETTDHAGSRVFGSFDGYLEPRDETLHIRVFSTPVATSPQ